MRVRNIIQMKHPTFHSHILWALVLHRFQKLDLVHIMPVLVCPDLLSVEGPWRGTSDQSDHRDCWLAEIFVTAKIRLLVVTFYTIIIPLGNNPFTIDFSYEIQIRRIYFDSSVMIFTDTTVSLIGFYASKEVKTWKMCFVFLSSLAIISTQHILRLIIYM